MAHAKHKSKTPMPGGGAPSPSLLLRNPFRILKALLPMIFIATIVSTLLFGHLIYPSSPLLLPVQNPLLDSKNSTCFHSNIQSGSDQCVATSNFRRHAYYHRFKLSLATLSFVFATSTRTIIMAPLLRLRGKPSLPFHTAMSSILDAMDSNLDAIERFSHVAWEEVARQSNAWKDGPPSFATSPTYYDPPEIDLNVLVPCEHDVALRYLLERQNVIPSRAHLNNDNQNDSIVATGHKDDVLGRSNDSCRLRDVINRQLVVEYVKVVYDDQFDLATHPLILRNVWPPESFVGGTNSDDNGSEQYELRRLTPTSIMNDPQLSNLILPNYFSDATKTGYDALVPDRDHTTLSDFMQGILSSETPNAKIGTQVIVEQYPELRDEIVPVSLAKELFGWNTWLEDGKTKIKKWLGPSIGRWIDKLPAMSCFPIFIASNRAANGASSSSGANHPRTDLHTEPIGNVASQLHGTRQWTLVPTKWSGLLRPTVSKHRGYFYSNMDPLTELPQRLESIPIVFKCTTKKGDAIWIPPWMWHRVDYDSGTGDRNESSLEAAEPEEQISIGASIFHFYPLLFVKNFPLLSYLIIPNLIQEVLGFNIE